MVSGGEGGGGCATERGVRGRDLRDDGDTGRGSKGRGGGGGLQGGVVRVGVVVRVGAGEGLVDGPSVSLLRLNETVSFICSFYLNVSAYLIVLAPRFTIACCWDT